MNKRFFELAKEVGIIQWDSLPSGDLTPDHESVVKAKKFAELIVKECVEYLDGNSGYDECGNALNPKTEEVLKHFGVK